MNPTSMTPWRSSLLRLATLTTIGTAGSVHAQLYWDANGNTAGSGTPAAGTWDTGTNWTSVAAGTGTPGLWANGQDVIFSAGTEAAGTWAITIGGSVTTHSITFNGTANTVHNISGGTIDIETSGLSINATAAGAAGGRSKTISSSITGSGGLTVAANGDTSISGGGSNTVFSLTGTNTFFGDTIITSGVVGSTSNFGDPSNKIILNGGGLVFTASSTLDRQIEIGTNGGVIRNYGAATTTLSGEITGTGELRRTDGGTATFTHPSPAFTGSLNIGRGTTQLGTGTETTVPLANASSITIGDAAAGATLRYQLDTSLALATPVTLSNVASSLIWQGTTADDELTINTTIGSSTTNGILRANSGIIRFTNGANISTNRLEVASLPANNATPVFGHLVIEDGANVSTAFLDIGSGNNQSGLVDQTGGTITLSPGSNGVRIGHWGNGATPGSVYNLSGGVLDVSATNVPLNVGWDGAGTFNVSGTGIAKAWRLYVDAAGVDQPGIVNLETGGTIEVGAGGILNDGTTGSQINLKGGTLRSTASSTWASRMEISGANPTTWDLNPSTTTVVSGVVSGAGDLIVTGTGNLSITGLNTFNGSFTYPAGGTLSGTGRIVAASVIDGTISPGPAAGGTGTLDFGNTGVPTTINGRVIFDLDAAGNAASSDLVTVFDSLNFGPESSLKINFSSLPTQTSYPLFTYGGTLNSIPTIEPDQLNVRGVSYSIDTSTPGSVRLFASGTPTPETVTWSGDGLGNTWDLTNSVNWNSGSELFYQFDSVVFDDSGNNDSTITLVGDLKPNALTFTGSKNYTFAGSGQITSNAALTISGTNTVNLDAKIRLGTINLSEGSLVIKDNAEITGSGNVTVGANASFVIDRSTPFTFNRAFTAGSTGTFVKNGTGNLTTTGFVLFPNKLTVNQGTMTVTGSGFSSNRMEGNGLVTVNSGATLVIPAGNSHAFGGDNATMTESFVINGGTFTVNQEQYLNKLTLNGGTINGSSEIRSSSTGNLWTVTGTTPSTISCSINNFNTTNVAVEDVTADAQPDLIASGSINSNGFVKSGTGTFRLGGGSTTYNGNNTVNAGTLQLATNTALGFGGAIGNTAVGITTVNAGGSVDLNGTTANEAITLNGGALVNSNAATTATLSNGIAGVRLTAVGAGYTAAPTLTFTGGGGTGTTNTVALNGNALSSITTTAAGTGYTSTPTVTINGTNTTPATATAVISSITLNASTTNSIGGAGALNVPALISGTGSLTKVGTGTLTLPTAVHTFSGAFTVDAGTVVVTGGAGNLPTSPTALGAKDPARLITVNPNGTLNFTVNNVLGGSGQTAATLPTLEVKGTLSTTRFNTIGNLILNGGTLTNSSSDTGGYQGFQFIGSVSATGPTPSIITSTNGKANHLLGNATTVFNVADVTGNDDSDLIVVNPINNGSNDYGGASSLEKTGAGTLHLQAVNAYTGTTTVTAGTLKGATTLAGPLNVSSGGTIAPGNSAGTLIAGNTTLAGAYSCEIDGTSSDRLTVNGDLNLTGSTLNLQVLSGGATQSAYIIASYTGTLTGTFATVNNLPAGYALDYAYNDGTSTRNIALVANVSQPAYTTWANANGLATFDPNVDSDGDGIPNGIEFVIGGDPSGPNSNSLHLLPTTTIDATYFNFTFRRTTESAEYNPYVQFGSDLTGWTIAEGGENGVIIEETAEGFGEGVDRVIVRIPRNPHASSGKIFARLAVDIDDN